jgi:hypothetical protein
MAESESNHRDDVPEAPAFVTTHWSVVLAAGRSDTTRAQAALEHLCRIYWYPIYHFVRRQGHSTHDAQETLPRNSSPGCWRSTGSPTRTNRADGFGRSCCSC